MKRNLRRIMSVALIAALFAGVPRVNCFAMKSVEVEKNEDAPEVLMAVVSENVGDFSGVIFYTSLAQCIISVSGSDEGMLINISTGASGTAKVVGVKDIKIQKKMWYGWKTVATSSGGEVNDRTTVGISILYANAVKDETYRITCVHYGDVNGYVESENDTDAFVYTY